MTMKATLTGYATVKVEAEVETEVRLSAAEQEDLFNGSVEEAWRGGDLADYDWEVEYEEEDDS
jgi:hypothetical protein